MKRTLNYVFNFWLRPVLGSFFTFHLFLFMFCNKTLPEGKSIDALPPIFPDYVGVTIPANIAPLNFKITEECEKVCVAFAYAGYQIIVYGNNGKIKIPVSDWKELLSEAAGQSISVDVYVMMKGEWLKYNPFSVIVAAEPMDPYIAYRLIEPGYTLWGQMGLYQRHLESYKQTAIIENKMTGNNCMNCHSFRMQDPSQMLFHSRETFPSTIVIKGDKAEKLNTKTDKTPSFLVYPSWHPEGRFVAFSVNVTQQAFHMNHRNRVEVFDEESDVVIYDTETHEVFTSPLLFSKDRWETFPTFSPDGKTLYFCSAEPYPIVEFEKIKYSLFSVSFDPSTRSFGSSVDTLYNAVTEGGSVSFPRVSPDGKYLLYTLSGYGNFSIWHKDADLYIYDLEDKTSRALDEVNSNDVDSYHSWSSNSRWFVFSSRRIDGLYTRPYFAYIDEQGRAGKPFLLPQKDADYYHELMKSYNIPEFIKGKVNHSQFDLSRQIKNDRGIDVKFVGW